MEIKDKFYDRSGKNSSSNETGSLKESTLLALGLIFGGLVGAAITHDYDEGSLGRMFSHHAARSQSDAALNFLYKTGVDMQLW